MNTLKAFGFFHSDQSEEKAAELAALTRTTPHPQQQHILHYLDTGKAFLALAGLARDLLDTNRSVICAPQVLTDGVWAWTSDVIFYVRKYNLRLPDDFVAHMQANNWQPPQVEDLSSLRL